MSGPAVWPIFADGEWWYCSPDPLQLASEVEEQRCRLKAKPSLLSKGNGLAGGTDFGWQVLVDGLILPCLEVYGGIRYLASTEEDLRAEIELFRATLRLHRDRFPLGLFGITDEGYVTYNGRIERMMPLVGSEADTTWL